MAGIDWDALGERVVALTERLVATLSVVDTDGEARVAELLHGYLAEQLDGTTGVELKLADVPKPTSKCKAVLAYLPAAKPTARTLLLMGHIDTVGLEPYGSLATMATDSAALKAHYAGSADPELAAHAASPDWAFGRGWHDMKGGVAVICELFLEAASQGGHAANLVLLLTPDEESASRGLRALVPELQRLKAQHDLDFAYVLNADYTAPLHAGDQSRYWYSGVVGKLLLGVSVFGRSTHVGETFDGLNSTALAGYLASTLEHDRKLLAGTGGEWLPPPTVLRVADRRERYDVMTTSCAELYANVFHLGGPAKPMWRELLHEVRRLVNRYDREMRRRYNRFVARANQELPRYKTRAEVISYSTLLERATAHVGNIAPRLAEFRAEAAAQHTDERERALHVIRKLYGLLPPGRPTVVLSLLPPYYPAQLPQRGNPEVVALKGVCDAAGMKQRRVYPYISDMSYFSFGSSAELAYWGSESPLWFEPGEAESYAEIAAPVCNIGPWGIGAHTAEERVYLPFLRDTLPRILWDSLAALARSEEPPSLV